jgi:hypothetical protein
MQSAPGVRALIKNGEEVLTGAFAGTGKFSNGCSRKGGCDPN